MLKQPQFNWEEADKYSEWKAFILEVKNILSTYNVQEHDKITIVKNCLGRKGLHYIESITEAESRNVALSWGCLTLYQQSFGHNSMKL